MEEVKPRGTRGTQGSQEFAVWLFPLSPCSPWFIPYAQLKTDLNRSTKDWDRWFHAKPAKEPSAPRKTFASFAPLRTLRETSCSNIEWFDLVYLDPGHLAASLADGKIFEERK